jgi:hypothetical protein
MAIAEYTAVLRSWRWMLAFMLLAIGIATLLPDREALGEARELAADRGWRHAATGDVPAEALKLTIDFDGSRTFASLALPMDEALRNAVEFFALDVCGAWTLSPSVPPVESPVAEGWVMLASVREGQLDFNRNYAIWPLVPGGDTCAKDEMPRRSGDGEALLQVQLRGQAGSTLSIESLRVTPLREVPAWRWTRWVMLSLGLALLLLRFIRNPYRPRLEFGVRALLELAGLGVVLGIVFGCCVSVPLKADIFALLTGGRSLPAPADVELLLSRPFPLGGFSLFTLLHGVLFAAATVALQLLHRTAWLDLLLLGAMTETLQRFVPGRGPGISDMVVDWSGVGLGLLVVFLLRRSHRVRLLLKQ